MFMVEISDLEKDFAYTIEFDDGTEFVHLYFAQVIDIENTSFVRFEPLYELGKDVERKISGETVIIPYSKLIRIVKRFEPE